MFSSNKKFIIKFLLVFFIIYDINFKFLPGFTSGRISFIIILSSFLFKWISSGGIFSKMFLKENGWYFYVLIFVFLIAFLQYLSSNDISQLARLFYFTIYGIITPLILNIIFKNSNDFLLTIGISVLIQSLITLGSYIMPSVKIILNNLVLYNAHFDASNNIRALGFVSVAGAAFSLIQFTGIFSILTYLKLNYVKWQVKILLNISIIIILISTLFIGRTGLFLSIFVLLLFFVFNEFSVLKNFIAILSFVLISQLNFEKVLDSITKDIDGYNSELFIAWIRSGFRLNNDLVEGLNEMPIPPLTYQTLIGTGLVSGPNGEGNASGHDTGYIQTYYSMGLIVAFVFYISYFYYLFVNARKEKLYVSYLLLFILVLVESKEFFIFSYAFPFFVFSYILIVKKGRKQNVIFSNKYVEPSIIKLN
jgi:hypothetical protein